MIEFPPDLEAVVAFHGHHCPGLLIGFRAAQIGLARLGSKRSEDEELIAIVENNSCAVDAVQALTGATFGKGNLFFRDYGKQVFTFALRPSGKGVRVALKAAAFPPGLSREERTQGLLSKRDEELFSIVETTVALPAEAEIRKSVVCEKCGEQVMETRTRKISEKVFAYGRKRPQAVPEATIRTEERTVCIPCAENAKKKS